MGPVEDICRRFAVGGEVRAISPLGRGHINDTFLVQYERGPDRVLQRLNTHVFPLPHQVMDNILRVSRHLETKVSHLPHGQRRYLRVVLTETGEALLQDAQQQAWRMYDRVDPALNFDRLETRQQAGSVGRSFGQFQAQLADLPEPRLHETIADFHHTPRRLKRLQEVAEADPHRRLAAVGAEIDFVLQRQARIEHLQARFERGELPERITHNDTKLNNLLFDEHGHEPLCVVDLDTVMPGLVHFDFGDMIRTGCNLADEDEADLHRVGLDFGLFEAMAGGYLEAGKDFLTPAEVDELPASAALMTLELGIRFLTDHLEGDRYFKIHHPGHNLQRARSQFALVKSLEQAEPRMQDWMLTRWQQLLQCAPS